MYRIFGYNEVFEYFDIEVNSFVKAVEFIRNSSLSTIYVYGFSKKVCREIGDMLLLNIFYRFDCTILSYQLN